MSDEIYAVTVFVEEESQSMAYQLVGAAIKKMYKKKRGRGIRAPTNFEQVSGTSWK